MKRVGNLWSNLSLWRHRVDGFSAEGAAFFARATTIPAGDMPKWDTFFKALKAANIYSKFDAIYILAAADSTIAKLNLISSSFPLTETSAPTFTQYRGYAGNGTSSFLSTGVAPNGLTQYTQNSAHGSIWVNTVGNTFSFGEAVATPQLAIFESGTTLSAVVNATTGPVKALYTFVPGLYMADRTGATTTDLRFNNTSLSTGVQASAAPISNNILIGRVSSTLFGTDLISACSLGAGLTPTEANAYYAALLALLQSVGAA